MITSTQYVFGHVVIQVAINWKAMLTVVANEEESHVNDALVQQPEVDADLKLQRNPDNCLDS